MNPLHASNIDLGSHQIRRRHDPKSPSSFLPHGTSFYVSDFENGQLTRKFEHLACFYPGLLALAATTLDLPKTERELYMWAAEGLGHSCWIMYADQASGLGPELARMDGWPGDWRKGRWIDHVDAWQRSGSPGGKPPGVKDLSPPVKSGQQKDYHLDVSTYLSRPEVPFLLSALYYCVLILCVCRRWKACSCCGAQQEMSNGESTGGQSGKLLRRRRAHPVDTPAFRVLIRPSHI